MKDSVSTIMKKSCGGDDETAIPGPWPNPACFQGGVTPQLNLDGLVAHWTWNDPHVLKVGSEYWMYASATDNFVFPVMVYRLVASAGYLANSPGDFRVGHAVSNDGGPDPASGVPGYPDGRACSTSD